MDYCPGRRRLLTTAVLALPLAAAPGLLMAAPGTARRLSFYHTHTGEKLDVVYHDGRAYQPDALRELDHLLRDFRSDEVTRMDPALLDFLHASRERLGGTGTYEIISAYRSPRTNEMLRKKGGGVARRSQHVLGKAIDVRLTDADTGDLRQVGIDLSRGGVGYYARSDFVHLDTGRVRRW